MMAEKIRLIDGGEGYLCHAPLYDAKTLACFIPKEIPINECMEKQIPKKPTKKNPIVYQKDKDGQEHYAYDYHCPLCDEKIKLSEHHCICGQAIDWSE